VAPPPPGGESFPAQQLWSRSSTIFNWNPSGVCLPEGLDDGMNFQATVFTLG